MKKTLNDAVRNAVPGKKIDEIFLFREMASAFNTNYSQCTYVEEVHGNKGQIAFNSEIANDLVHVELGDLLIFTYNRFLKEMKMCIMQVKYKKGGYKSFLRPRFDVIQWELLRNRPDIINCSPRFHFPTNILNFNSKYLSITAYGIFYEDNVSKEIDFLYTIPENLYLNARPVYRKNKNKIRTFHFTCGLGIGSPNPICCIYENRRETTETCSIDVFEKQMLAYTIGAPIPPSLRGWVVGLFRSMRNRADDPRIIDDIMETYYFNNENLFNDAYAYENMPAALILKV